MTSHFLYKHPEFKFHRDKQKRGEQHHIICDICGKPANSFTRLVRAHSHFTKIGTKIGDFVAVVTPVPKPNPTFNLQPLSEFATSLHNLVNEVADLRTEKMLWKEKEADLERQLTKRTAQVIAAQTALADVK
jgi:hypothetical protein